MKSLSCFRTSLVIATALAAAFVASGCTEQSVARNFGGTSKVEVPKGHQLMSVSWREANLWVLTYEPATKTCYLRESSSFGMMEGNVVFKDCDPLTVLNPS